ncbi:MAG TPA: guanylate cyclase [Gemmatimonadota bacterium]|nr:guanylate cyclase [Gemmatimonadota bacterium]
MRRFVSYEDVPMPEKSPRWTTMSPIPFLLASWVAKLAAIVALIVIILMILPYPLQYVEDAERYEYVQKAVDLGSTARERLGAKVREYVPTRIAGEDRTLWFLVGGFLLVEIMAARVGGAFGARADYLKLKKKVESWEKDMGLSKDSAVTSTLNAKLTALKDGTKEDREELLKIFAETKRKLSGMGRELAFLSIDIVDSTKMKIGEDQETIEYDFKQYKTFVDDILKANGVIKVAWTPDGIMACFSNIDTAVKTGKDVIRGLRHFNSERKLMKSDFRVRCGVNSGYVYMDDDVPLEEVSDRVIDIAGHMQKHAEPMTVSVAKTVVEPMTDRQGFQETPKIVDGYQVYAWSGDQEEGS